MQQLDDTEYYKKVDRNYRREHEENINDSDQGCIERDISKLLRHVNSRTPVFYMLPKIHKTNNPGRPVVSSVNSCTEISAYVDNYDRWLNAYPPTSMTQLTSLRCDCGR